MSIDATQSGRDHRLAKVLVVPLCGLDGRKFSKIFELLHESYTPLTGMNVHHLPHASVVAVVFVASSRSVGYASVYARQLITVKSCEPWHACMAVGRI